MLFSQIIPPLPSSTESKRLFCTSMGRHSSKHFALELFQPSSNSPQAGTITLLILLMKILRHPKSAS